MEHQRNASGTPDKTDNQLVKGKNGAGVSRSRKDQERLFIIAGFRAHLKRLGYAKSTVSMLPTCALELLETSGKVASHITPTDIQAHYEHLQNRPNKRRAGGLSERMITHHLYALKVFFHWLLESGSIASHPMNTLRFPSPKDKPREVLTQQEIKRLYAATETAIERAILALCYGCGLRRSEAEKLNVKDVQLATCLLYVRAGKGGKRRVVPLSEGVKRTLKHYLDWRSAPPSEEAFLLNRLGRRMRGDAMNRALKSLLARAEIEKHISLHNLRHSIATHLLQQGLSVEYVRDFLGHKHLEATQLYTRIDGL